MGAPSREVRPRVRNPPLAPKRGMIQTQKAAASISCATVCPVKKRPDQRSGVRDRTTMPTVIQSRTPSGTPAAVRTRKTPSPEA